MNEYKFEDMYVGLEESFEREITQKMMEQFLDITGDINPLHNEEDFAKERGYEGKVVYGLLTSAMISTLGGVYLPGKFCIIQGNEMKYKKPVYVGNVLKITGKVKELHESVQQATIDVIIENENKKVVAKGKLKVGFLSE